MNERVDRLLARNPAFLAALLGLAVLTLAQVLRIAVSYDNPVDFRYFWAAGRIWSEGGNPYDASFSSEAEVIYGIEGFHRWTYSPHLWPLTTVLAGLPFRVAFWVWTGLFLASVLAGSALIAASLPRLRRRIRLIAAAGLTLYTVTAFGGAATQTIGQFAAFAYLGVAAFVFAMVRERSWAMVLALFILTIKASLGLPFLAFAVVLGRWWTAILIAGGLALLAGTPVYLASGLPAILAGYLDGIAAYGGYSANSPASMTGLRNLLDRWFGVAVSGLPLALLASLAGLLLGRLTIGEAEARRRVVTVFLALTFFLVPLHLYDLMLVSALVVGIGSRVFAVMLGLAFILLFRVNHLSEALGLPEPGSEFVGSYLASLVLLALFVAACTGLVGWQASARRTVET